ncbi:MAG: A/G-specific adenine glycosylase [Alphaproteobacteria bacterium]|nr:A/G-specific adenine glycosylase [Alphaproteobacteria bacterium]
MPLTKQLLGWYRTNGRDMPWRVKGGAHSDPYAVWISEIMLQQTTVQTVRDYFLRWMKRFPDVQTLATADISEVLLLWQGLGYYTRARKIHECAQILVQHYAGKIPADREKLLKLPGIGPYTASSICCFAFNLPETVVDGNVIRVLARLYGLTHAVTKEEIYELAKPLTPKDQGADYASAIMDLGATICTPDNPKCPLCPWRNHCVANKKNLTNQIPLLQKPQKQNRIGNLWLIRNSQGSYCIRKRLEKGLLSGLYEFPWRYDSESPLYPLSRPAFQITHTFTHFKLTLRVYCVSADTPPIPDGLFVPLAHFGDYPFSTLMRKVIHKI